MKVRFFGIRYIIVHTRRAAGVGLRFEKTWMRRCGVRERQAQRRRSAVSLEDCKILKDKG